MANTIGIQIELEGKDALKTIKALEKGFKGFGKTGEDAVDGISKSFETLKGVVGAAAVLKGIDLVSRAFKEGARNALEFGVAIQEINSIAARSAKETLALKQQLIGLSNEYGGDAQKQARAFYNIVSAGVKGTANQLETLEVANRAAVAGLVDIDTSARVLVSSVNSYAASGLTAAQASDVLFSTVKAGITTFGELSGSLGTVAPLASAAGLSFSELGGTLAFLTKSGISTAEATTGLRAVLTGVIKPSVEAAKFAKDLGLQFDTAAIKSKGFAGFLKEVITATKGSEVELAKLFPNVRALGPIIQIASGNFEEFVTILNDVEGSTGATSKALQTITESAGFQFEKLTTQLKNFPTAILTNFEEPLADALKAINEFVGGNGLLLVADAVDAIITAFQAFNKTASEVDQFFNFLAGGVLELAKVMVSIESNVDQFFNFLTAGALETSKAWNEFSLAANRAEQTVKGFLGADEVVEGLKKQEQQILKNIEAIDQSILANDTATAKLQQNEEKKLATIDAAIEANQRATVAIQVEEEKRFNAAENFRKKIQAGRDQVEADEEARRERSAAKDEENAKKQLEAVVAGEQAKFDAIKELKAVQAEEEAIAKEEAKLAKELEAEEDFQFLADNLGKEAALKELNRIKDIDDEKKRQTELLKLKDKARKEEQKGILSLQKFENLTNSQKIAAQKATLGTIAQLGQSNNKTLFAIGKAASLSLAGINVAEGVTKALAAFPPPFNFAAAAAVGAAGAINVAKIASAKPPSAGSFQSGGIIEGPSQTGDNLTAQVNSGEVIFNRRQQENLFKAVDSGSVGGQGSNISINVESATGDVPQESIDRIIDGINNRTEFGNKELRTA